VEGLAEVPRPGRRADPGRGEAASGRCVPPHEAEPGRTPGTEPSAAVSAEPVLSEPPPGRAARLELPSLAALNETGPMVGETHANRVSSGS
jgi:hypothetical protein